MLLLNRRGLAENFRYSLLASSHGLRVFSPQQARCDEGSGGRARSHGLGVMVDASSAGFLSDMGPEVFLGLISQATVLRCNEEEAQLLSGESYPEGALASMGERFERVIVTQGSRGSMVWEDGTSHHVPALPVEKILDPTGAGDAFNAGILAGLSQGVSIIESTARATRLAARCVTRLGARP